MTRTPGLFAPTLWGPLFFASVRLPVYCRREITTQQRGSITIVFTISSRSELLGLSVVAAPVLVERDFSFMDLGVLQALACEEPVACTVNLPRFVITSRISHAMLHAGGCQETHAWAWQANETLHLQPLQEDPKLQDPAGELSEHCHSASLRGCPYHLLGRVSAEVAR